MTPKDNRFYRERSMTTEHKFTPGLVDPIQWRKMHKAPEMYELLVALPVFLENLCDMSSDNIEKILKFRNIAEELLQQIDGKEK